MNVGPGDQPVTVLDVHAHHLGADVVDGSTAGGPSLVIDSQGNGQLASGGTAPRAVPAAMWSVSARLREMDRAGISHQVISPLPAAMEHAWNDPAYARSVNDSIARACQEARGRLIGLGCLSAAGCRAEASRCLALGLRGIEVGTTMAGLDLDDLELAEVWQVCEDSDLAVFVHPTSGGRSVVRRDEGWLAGGLGMVTDTALAAYSLASGGVLASRPRLRVLLAHGGGTFAWVYPRIRALAAGSGANVEEWDALIRRMYVDTLVFDPEQVPLLAHRFGVDRLVLGSDCPYLPHETATLLKHADDALAADKALASARADILAGNGLRLLGVDASGKPSEQAKRTDKT